MRIKSTRQVDVATDADEMKPLMTKDSVLSAANMDLMPVQKTVKLVNTIANVQKSLIVVNPNRGKAMKVNFIKQPGGVLVPADDREADRLTKFKTGEMYEVEIKRSRNPAFHRKGFAFFNFCFEHWRSDREFMNEHEQFKSFRNHLTVLAGYYTETFNINGGVRIEAMSLSFGSMDEETFESCYNSMITAACKHIFKTTDDNTYNQLLDFFN